MPTYDRYCYTCDEIFEIRRSMSDASPVACPKCGGEKNRQVFVTVPAMFTRNIDHPDSPLDDMPNAPQMRKAADIAIRKAMKDMGR